MTVKLEDLKQKRRKLSKLINDAERLSGRTRGGDAYDRHKADAASRSRDKALLGRDIGPLPRPADPVRRIVCATDFRLFCLTYFPDLFVLAFSADHLKIVAKTEESVIRGGLFALAMPRGSGKTTMAEVACVWAVLNGHRGFPVLIGSDAGSAAKMLESVKTELETNDRLLEDFPESCLPIRALDGIAHRCNGQVYGEERTHVGWTADEVVLPTLKPQGWLEDPDLRAFVRPDGFALGAGAIVKVAGITGRIRGLKYRRASGGSARPDLVIIDDPQSDESANSPSQCATRERTLAGAVLGLAGPGKKISGIMPCTVIRAGDMADNILDRDKHPEWNGERCKMVYAFPGDEALWTRYADLRGASLRAGGRGEDATEFYRENREAMDRGASVAWPERHNYDELSAVQHAMNLLYRDRRAFFSEYQNQPVPEDEEESDALTADQVAGKLNGLPRGRVPLWASRLTAFIDVQQSLLFYAVCAWSDEFSGAVLAYGTYPDQGRAYFTLRDAKKLLAGATGVDGVEAQVYRGLTALGDSLLGASWEREDGAGMKVERLLVDAGFMDETVRAWVRAQGKGDAVLPSFGRYYGARKVPIGEWAKKEGERLGQDWIIRKASGPHMTRHVLFDSNRWKTFLNARLRVAYPNPGALALFGKDPVAHRMLADHLTSEKVTQVSADGRTVGEWELIPNRDNHWYDCVIGCAVAASTLGVALPDSRPAGKPAARPRMSLADMKAKAKAGRK